jgi:uncharacterized protein (TIGR02246 family)
MRHRFAVLCIAGLAALALAQEPATPHKAGESQQPAEPGLKEMFEAKIKAEWEALKTKDRKAYAELLADDYQGVEVDGRGERNKIQSLNELAAENVYNYTLSAFNVTPLGPDAAMVIYEVTMQFPPTAEVRYSRVYITEIWVKRAGQWKELHYQETHVK